MSTDLSPDAESFIQQQIALGTYRNRNNLLEEGVELLRRRHQLQARLFESRRQLDAGESTEFDDDQLHEFFSGLKQRARTKSEAQ